MWTNEGLQLLATCCLSVGHDQCCNASHSQEWFQQASAFYQVYVLKRPYVDEFLRRMGELFECVLFTASLAKVPGSSRGENNWEQVGQP